MSEYPSTMESVRRALELWGGWSKMFRMSSSTYDEKHIVMREGDPRFWGEFAKILADKQFRDSVEEAVLEFRIAYPQIKLPKDELRKKLARALLEEGWKPVKSRILKEIRDYRRSKKEDIACLRKSLKRKSKPRK